MRPSPVVNYGWHLSKGLGFDNTGRIPLSLIYLLFFSKKKRKKKNAGLQVSGIDRTQLLYTGFLLIFVKQMMCCFFLTQQKLLFLVTESCLVFRDVIDYHICI